jgi:hypothetical protein
VNKVAAVAENGAPNIKQEGGSGGVQVKEEEGDKKRRRNRWGDPATPAVKLDASGRLLMTRLTDHCTLPFPLFSCCFL